VPKLQTNWSKLIPGDIVSFRYEPSDKVKPIRTHSILILNSKYPKTLKNGEKKFYINALKLEESNRVIFNDKRDAWDLLKRMGWITIRSLGDQIYSVKLDPKYIGTFGAKETLYKMLMATRVGRKAEYRTYSWESAMRSAVFYEPIKLPKDKIKMLMEQREGKWMDKNGHWRDLKGRFVQPPIE
jgi:hypothetical protein